MQPAPTPHSRFPGMGDRISVTSVFLILTPIPMRMFFPNTPPPLREAIVSYSFNSILTPSVWRQHRIPKSAVPHDGPFILELIPSPGCHLCFWPAGSGSGVPTTSSLHSINLLEWLKGLRETFYLPLYDKRMELVNSPTEEMHRTGYWDREGAGLPCSLS